MTRTEIRMANRPWPARRIAPADVSGTLAPSHVPMRAILADGGTDRGVGPGGRGPES